MHIFDALRTYLDISTVLDPFTQLRREGSRLVGRCPLPNHRDSTPSFNVYPDRHAHCYGCGFHGDVTDIWSAIRGLNPGIEAAIDLARTHSIRLPDRDPIKEAEEQSRRQQEIKYARIAKSSHEELLRQPRIAEYWQARGFDDELQKRFLLGSNRDGTSAIIPFWHRGRIYGIIRRQLQRDPKYLLPEAKNFPNGYKPLFIPTALQGDVYIVEGFVDALALAAMGFNVVAIGGNKISSKQLEDLQRFSEDLFILPDADRSGVLAEEWTRLLYPRSKICPAEYGEGLKDVADLFAAGSSNAREVILSLRERAIDALDIALSKAPKDSKRATYRFTKEQVLPLIARIEDEGERQATIEDASKALSFKVSELRKELNRELSHSRDNTIAKPEAPEPGTAQYEQAMKLLNTPNILQLAATDMECIGHVGEASAKQLAFICALSARMGTPIQPSTHAQSSAGKNALWDTVLSLFPPEMVIRRSGLSAKALFRTEACLEGAILYIQEVAGSESADYSIRVLQSDGSLEYESTERMPNGNLQNVVHKVNGPTVIVQTTTKNHLHPENETRVFPIYIDESEEQTERIIQTTLRNAAGKGIDPELIKTKQNIWQNAIRLLQSCTVVIPFAERITIPNSPIRIRRDIHRVLDVIRVIAWLHQYQRHRDSSGRILATEEDFNVAIELVRESLERAWKTLTPAEEKVLSAIEELPVGMQREGFRRRDIQVPSVSERRIKEILRSLAGTGYLDCEGKRGPQGYTYTMARKLQNISPCITLSPSPEEPEIPENNEHLLGDAHSARSHPSGNGDRSCDLRLQAASGEEWTAH